MNFKSWFILSEELYLQNNTATIFHRTKSFDFVQQMMNGGFTAGIGAYHGPGLYSTYTLEGTTNLGYGPYVVKLKVNNLKNYFVLEPDIAKQIHGDKWKLKDQAKILKLKLKLTAKQWQKYQKISESGKFGSAAASQALKDDGHKLWENGCKGIVYNGQQDGKCICVYAPYEDLQFLAYAYAPAPTTVDFIEKNWIKSGKGVSIRSISDLKFPKDTGIGTTSVEKQYELSNPEDLIPSEIFDDIKIGEYTKLKLYIMKNKLSTISVFYLLRVASDKDKIAKILGPNNINKLSNDNVSDLLRYTSDKEKMAEILGPENINKLNNDNVYEMLAYTYDKGQMARILSQDNIDKIDSNKIVHLLHNTSNMEEMVRILGQERIDNLSIDDIEYLLGSAVSNPSVFEVRAKILGEENINKLTGDQVFKLIRDALHKYEIVRILGQNNIDKLTGNEIKIILVKTMLSLNKNSMYKNSIDENSIAKIVKTLGEKNIDKLSAEDIEDLDRMGIEWWNSDI